MSGFFDSVKARASQAYEAAKEKVGSAVEKAGDSGVDEQPASHDAPTAHEPPASRAAPTAHEAPMDQQSVEDDVSDRTLAQDAPAGHEPPVDPQSVEDDAGDRTQAAGGVAPEGGNLPPLGPPAYDASAENMP